MFELRTQKIVIFSLIMIVFGIIEMFAGLYFTHKYVIGGSYLYEIFALDALCIVGGLLFLTMRQRGTAFALLLMVANIIGRGFLILSHMFPFSDFGPEAAMILGTIIAMIFAFYLWLQLGNSQSS